VSKKTRAKLLEIPPEIDGVVVECGRSFSWTLEEVK